MSRAKTDEPWKNNKNFYQQLYTVNNSSKVRFKSMLWIRICIDLAALDPNP